MVNYYDSVEGYLARPKDEGPFPLLVLIHEWRDLNQDIKDLADDFAREGYVALAVNSYGGALVNMLVDAYMGTILPNIIDTLQK